MNNNQCLYTPTDWNRECELMKGLLNDYFKYLHSLKTPLDVITIFKEQGILWEVDNQLSFDEWRNLYYPSKHEISTKCIVTFDFKSSLLNKFINN